MSECILYDDAMEELLARAEAKELPEVVFWALAYFFKTPAKLFCCHLDLDLAGNVRTSGAETRLEASQLLVKLVLAVRALNWEVILVTAKEHGYSYPSSKADLLACREVRHG